MNTTPLASLTDSQLLSDLRALLRKQRHATALVLAHLAEVETRNLHLAAGCPSLFAYCTQVLHMSEGAAYRRITAARLGRKHPQVLRAIASGDVHLTAISLLASHITAENCDDLLARARHRSKRQVEALVAEIAPRPEVPTLIRAVPRREPEPERTACPSSGTLPTGETACAGLEAPATAAKTAPPTPHRAAPERVQPLSPQAYRVQFSADPETIALLKEAQDLLSHSEPSASAAQVFKRGLQQLVQELKRSRHAQVDTPRKTTSGKSGGRSSSRHIPADVKREVWSRDRGCCAFRGQGRRCGETRLLEYHHVRAFARGGPSTADNLELRCRAHNAYEARLEIGDWIGDWIRDGTHPGMSSQHWPAQAVWQTQAIRCAGQETSWPVPSAMPVFPNRMRR